MKAWYLTVLKVKINKGGADIPPFLYNSKKVEDNELQR